MGYGNNDYQIKTGLDDYSLKTFSGGHYGSSGYEDFKARLPKLFRFVADITEP